jgi:hypothetical protein
MTSGKPKHRSDCSIVIMTFEETPSHGKEYVPLTWKSFFWGTPINARTKYRTS